MVAIQHVYRRDATYWWRRRLPAGIPGGRIQVISLSLRTTCLVRARLVAAELTVAAERAFADLRRHMISPEDAQRILAKVAKEHIAKLDAVAAAEVAYGDMQTSRFLDRVAGWAYRLFSAQGAAAAVGDIEASEMRAAGLDDDEIHMVAGQLEQYRRSGVYPPNRHKIDRLLDGAGIPDTPTNRAQAEQLYLRGLSAALLDTRRRWTGVRPDDDALLQAALIAEASGAFSANSADNKPVPPYRAPGRAAVAGSFPEPEVRSPQSTSALDGNSSPDAAEREWHLVDIVVGAAAEKVQTGEWTEKTARQHVALARLFTKCVGQDNPTKIRQSDISDFRSILLKLPKNHGKIRADEGRTIEQILERAEALPSSQKGLSPASVNRYMTQIANIGEICKGRGAPFGNFEGVRALRVRNKGREREERGKFTTDEIVKILSMPVWQGRAGERDNLSSGKIIVHDSVYWMPVLGIYTGARREELAGLLLDEVDLSAECPNLRIEDNINRKVKTAESKRRIPIHGEILRLGFREYVAALRSAGHSLLFPELKPAAKTTPMGDVYDDDWREIRDFALPNAGKEGKVFHSLRHWCNNSMKQAGVVEETRRDILGHKNPGVNSSRYSDPACLELMARAIALLPLASSQIEPAEIRLRQSVHERRSPPSRRSRR